MAGEIIQYQTEDGVTVIRLQASDGSVWLSQAEMAELFQTTKQSISLHVRNILEEGELEEAATVKENLTVQTEGKRKVSRQILLYNLQMILAVGFRVRSLRGMQFRRWASEALSEYLVKGFVMDDARLKEPDNDYFEELLARIRDIRASEKLFYKKVLDIYATAQRMSWQKAERFDVHWTKSQVSIDILARSRYLRGNRSRHASQRCAPGGTFFAQLPGKAVQP